MKSSPLIYLIGCSIRNKSNQKEIVDEVLKIKNETFLYSYIEKIGRSGKISNSEGGLIAATFGIKKWTDKIKYIRLNNYFLKSGNIVRLNSLLKEIKKADGIVFSTPVYFGDRSSLLHDFIRSCRTNNVCFSEKVCGFISSGAKRNGGQETTNIYSLYSFSELGALVVGNGPPTSQFGGTIVGGNMGTMENDYFGIMTSSGVGEKVAQISSLIKEGKGLLKTSKNKKIKVDFWILEERRGQVKTYLNLLIKKLSYLDAGVEFNILDLTKNKFNRCFACDICPNGSQNQYFKCVNRNDDMIKLHRKLLEPDGIVVVGFSKEGERGTKSVYQRFVERTRYIRRDNFLLTNRLVAALSLSRGAPGGLFSIRALTSFIRHNTVFHKGIEDCLSNKRTGIEKRVLDVFLSFICKTRILTLGRKKIDIGEQKYYDIGY